FVSKLRSAAVLLAVGIVVAGISVLASRGASGGPPAAVAIKEASAGEGRGQEAPKDGGGKPGAAGGGKTGPGREGRGRGGGKAGEQAGGKPRNGLRLGVGPAAAKEDGKLRLLVVLDNVGTDDLVVNLGLMLANGKKQLPTAVRLIVIDGDGKEYIVRRNEV